MSITEHLKRHRSIRSFTDRNVGDDVLNEILECAARASTGGSMQLYSVVVTTDRARREILAALHLGSETIRNAPVTLTFCVDCHRLTRWLELHEEEPNFDNGWGFAIGFSDALLAAQNALIAAEAAELGGCFLGSTFAGAPAIAGFLKCPRQVVPVATLVIGHPAENPEVGTRLPLEAIVHREEYVDAPEATLRSMYEVHARATFERFCSIPYVKQAAKAANITELAGYYARLMYPRELIETAGAYFQGAVQAQGFASDAQLARIRAVQKAWSSPAIATLHPVRQLVFSMALVSGHLDHVLSLDPARAEANLAEYVLARDAHIFDQLSAGGLFDVSVRKRFLDLLAGFRLTRE